MNDITKSIALALCLGLASGPAAFAQETAPATEPAPAADSEAAAIAKELPLGEPAKAPDGPGTIYTAATFDSWEQRCERTADGADPCQMYQLLKDGKGNSVAEISLFNLPEGQPAAAGATIIVPLQTLLTEQLTIAIDTAQAKRYPFTWCAPVGCFARLGFTKGEVAAFKGGNKATMTIVPAGAPDQKVTLDISLKGFTAAFDAVTAANKL